MERSNCLLLIAVVYRMKWENDDVRFELKCKCCLLLLTLNSRKIVDCNGLCTSSCLFVAESSVLHSHTGIVWK